MKHQDNGDSVVCWISARETTAWGRRWPDSTLAGSRIMAEFNRHEFSDLAVFDDDGKRRTIGTINKRELNVIIHRYLKRLERRIGKEHSCYHTLWFYRNFVTAPFVGGPVVVGGGAL